MMSAMNNKESGNAGLPMVKKISFSVTLIVCFFILLECAGRVILAFYPEDYFFSKSPETHRFKEDYVLGWSWRPGYKFTEEKFGRKTFFSISQQGFKDREYSLSKPKNTIRIICVGDSITEGIGVNNNKTYPKVLEDMLNSEINAENIEVMNAGVSDYCIAQEYFLTKNRLLNFHPDIVIVGYYLNDGRNFARPKNFYGGATIKRLLEKSAFVKWLNLYITKIAIKVQFRQWEKGRERWLAEYENNKWMKDPAALDNLIASADRDWGSAWTQHGEANTEKYLVELKNLSLRHDFRLVVLFFPVDVQLYAQNQGKTELFYPQEAMRALCKENDISFLDISDLLKKHKGEDIFYDHCHYTERGMEIIATGVKEYLLLNNLLKD